MLLVSFNVVLVVVSTEPAFSHTTGKMPFNGFFYWVEIVSVVIFGLEYLVRIWSCVESQSSEAAAVAGDCAKRVRWAATPLTLTSAALLPFVIDLSVVGRDTGGLRGIMLIRLLRVFTLLRMERSFSNWRVARVLRSKRDELIVTFFIAFIILVLSASLMYYLENWGGSDDA